jgi:hypothetical protein
MILIRKTLVYDSKYFDNFQKTSKLNVVLKKLPYNKFK